MADQIFLRLCDGWALSADNFQWMLMRAKIRRGQREWQPVAFVATEKRILRRVLRGNGVIPTPEAQAALDTLPDTFRKWIRRQKATTPAASNQPANLGRAA